MDGVKEHHTTSKRLRDIVSVAKWQEQMSEIEHGSHCYGLPDTDAFEAVSPLWGFE